MRPSFPIDNRQSVKHSPLCRLSRGHMKKTQTDLLQGTLDLLALKTLRAGPTHGSRHCATYTAGLTGCTASRPGIIVSGAAPAGGARLDCFRMGASENNRKAKYYKLTAAGRKQLSAETETWRR